MPKLHWALGSVMDSVESGLPCNADVAAALTEHLWCTVYTAVISHSLRIPLLGVGWSPQRTMH
jgi:hypothetical protein